MAYMADQELKEDSRTAHSLRAKASSITLLILFWCGAATIWGTFLNWQYRHYMNPDGMSYLDIAREVLQSGPSALVNAHWSPLYPAAIALWTWAIRPGAYQEFAWIHVLNVVFYVAAACSFGYLVREMVKLRSIRDQSFLGQAIFICFAFGVFFRLVNMDVTPFVVTPDLLVATSVFGAAALVFRIFSGPSSIRPYLALGLVLGIGYLAKSIMLPAGALLLAMLLVFPLRSRIHRERILLAAGAMLIVAAPQIALVSRQVGHLSVSETGRLNHLWWVDGLDSFQGWTGSPHGDRPLHGPRVLSHHPEVLEFGSPIHGTYPLWYDPTYWHAGAHIRPDIKRQIEVMRNNLAFYGIVCKDLRYLLAGFSIILIAVCWKRRRWRTADLLFVLWPGAILGTYTLLFVEYRYATPFLILLCVAAFSTVLERIGRFEALILVLVCCTLVWSSITETLAPTRRTIVPGTRKSPFVVAYLKPAHNPPEDRVAAQTLSGMGLRPGDHIAVMGDAFSDFYAHIARLKVVAEVCDPADFWSMPESRRRTIEELMASIGARVLVAKNKPASVEAGPWREIAGTRYSVLQLTPATKTDVEQ